MNVTVTRDAHTPGGLVVDCPACGGFGLTRCGDEAREMRQWHEARCLGQRRTARVRDCPAWCVCR